MNVRQAVVAALKAVGEAGVVEAEQVQESCVEVVNVNRILADIETQLIRLPVDMA